MAFSSHMADIYSRLAKVGFDAVFLRKAILPDWWEDGLAKNPAERAIAEAAISRHLGIQISLLRDSSVKLSIPRPGKVQFKCRKGTDKGEALPGVLVAQRAARLVGERLRDTPSFRGPATAAAVRTRLLQQAESVNLLSLLNLCWELGIPVIPVCEFPKRSKRFDGLAFFIDETPVVVLGSKRDSPPWLIYHLAHEVAHILSGHIEPDTLLADEDIGGKSDDDPKETAAKEYACELLTGERDLRFQRTTLGGAGLAAAACHYGDARKIMPGVVALIYAKSAVRWGAAQNALKLLGEDRGAHQVISTALLSRMELDDLPESAARFLEHVMDVPLGGQDAQRCLETVSS